MTQAFESNARVTAVLASPSTVVRMETDGLMQEIERYLEAVALFRALGCQPAWRSEGLCAEVPR
jgi:hypothetical protein